MKIKLLVLFVFLSLFGIGQISPSSQVRVTNNVTTFGTLIPLGTNVFDVNTKQLYYSLTTAETTDNLLTAITKFKQFGLISSNDLPNSVVLEAAGGEVVFTAGQYLTLKQAGNEITIALDTTKAVLFNDTLPAGKIASKYELSQKQNTITNPITGTGTSGYAAIFTGTSTVGNGIINTSGTDVTLFSTFKGANSDGYNLFIGGGGQSSVGEVGATHKGSYNTFNGMQAGYSNTTGSQNTFNGMEAGYSNTTGFSNTFNGKDAGYYNVDGVNNLFSGFYSGIGAENAAEQSVSDTYMTLLGNYASRQGSGTFTNGTAIGYNAKVLASNQVVLGNDNVTTTLLKGSVGIATTAPTAAYLTTPGSTVNSSAVFGALELQSHAVGTQTIGSNLYYNGTNYKYRATNAGISSMIQINANGLLWHTAPAGSAGATATTTFRFGVDASGNGTFGGSITAKDTLKIGAARLYVPTGTLFESKGGVSTLTGLYVFDAARTTGLSITKIGTTSVVNANATDLTLDNIGIFKVKTFVTPSSYDRLTIDNAGVATFTNQVVTPVIAISSTDTASGTYPVGSMMLHIAAGDTSAWIKIRMTGSLTARWKKLTP